MRDSDRNAPARRAGLPNVTKIAVLRANALGDYFLTLPALAALRATYPDAEIVLLGRHWHASFLAPGGVRRPGPVDRVVVVPYSTGIYDPPGPGDRADQAELEHFFTTMREEQFDLAIQLHGGGRYSNPFVRELGARVTVGLRTPDAVSLDAWVPHIYYQHETMRSLEVVGLVGATTDELEPHLVVTPYDRAAAGPFLNAVQHPFAVLHPGAGDSRRRWPPASFAAVGDALAGAGVDVVVIGIEAERDLAAAVVEAMQAPAQNLAGRLSLEALAGLLSEAQVMVGNDSGPRHLAGAVGVPTVGIFWCGNLINSGPLTRTLHRQAIAWRLRCPVCDLDCTEAICNHRESFVADVPQEEVAAAAIDVLASASRMHGARPGG